MDVMVLRKYSDDLILCRFWLHSGTNYVHGDCHFKLVILGMTDGYTCVTCFYESEYGVWRNIVSSSMVTILFMTSSQASWLGMKFAGYLVKNNILQFDVERQSLVMTEKPVNTHVTTNSCFQVLHTEDSGLGIAIFTKLTMGIWERKGNSDCAVR
uniref:Uncharacterized protein n=1 Tax=Avena sativa TaxID=4498 RepID=A0ACD5WYM1_AVESA